MNERMFSGEEPKLSYDELVQLVESVGQESAKEVFRQIVLERSQNRELFGKKDISIAAGHRNASGEISGDIPPRKVEVINAYEIFGPYPSGMFVTLTGDTAIEYVSRLRSYEQ